MTRIDFYILEDTATRAGLTVASRLAEKAFRLGHRVYAHAPDEDTVRRLDEVMWTFRSGSFLPHAPLAGLPAAYGGAATEQAPALPVPVLIGSGAEPPEGHWDLLVNLDAQVPPFFSRYRRMAELVWGGNEQRAQARLRYRFYRDRGYELHTHRLPLIDGKRP